MMESTRTAKPAVRLGGPTPINDVLNALLASGDVYRIGGDLYIYANATGLPGDASEGIVPFTPERAAGLLIDCDVKVTDKDSNPIDYIPLEYFRIAMNTEILLEGATTWYTDEHDQYLSDNQGRAVTVRELITEFGMNVSSAVGLFKRNDWTQVGQDQWKAPVTTKE